MSEFQCFRRVGKTEFFGMASISIDTISFDCSSDPSVSVSFPLAIYSAQRQHPKLPMVQLRFTPRSAPPEDVTLVFKNTLTEAPDLDLLKAFLTAFHDTFQALRTPTQQPSEAAIQSSYVEPPQSLISHIPTPSNQFIPPDSALIPPVSIPELPPLAPPQVSAPAPQTQQLSVPTSAITTTAHRRPRILSLTPAFSQQLQREQQRLLDEDEELRGSFEVN